MSELEMESSETVFSQAGNIGDPSLNQLRDQIKKVMIPLLIKTFQLKLEHNQALSMPSRLQNNPCRRSREEIVEQLHQLDQDVKMLQLWCQSCRGQIQKALIVQEEEQKSPIAGAVPSAPNPAVSKSFCNAVSGQPSLFQIESEEAASEQECSPSTAQERKKWWRSLLKKW